MAIDKDAFMLQIGLSPDDQQNRDTIDKIIKTIEDTLKNEKFELGLDSDNIDKELEEVIKKIQVLSSNEDGVKKLQTTFESTTGSIVKLSLELEKAQANFISLNQYAKEFTNGSEGYAKALAVRTGIGYTNSGQKATLSGEVEKVYTGQSEQQIKTTIQLTNQYETAIKQVKSALEEQSKLQQQLDSLNTTTNKNQIQYIQTKLDNVNKEISQNRDLINSSKELQQIEEKTNQQIALSSAKKNDRDDQTKIQNAINLTKELAKAETELYNLRTKQGSPVAISESVQNVQKLTTEVNKSTSEQLSYGKTVNQTEQYQKAYAQATQEAASAQRTADEGYKTSGISLGQFGQQLEGVIQNVIQYKLA